MKHMKGYYYDEQTDRYYKRTGWGAPPFDRFIDRKESSEKTAARGNSSDQLESSGHIAGIFELLKRRECGRGCGAGRGGARRGAGGFSKALT